MPALDAFLHDIGAHALSTQLQLPPQGSTGGGPAQQVYTRLQDEIDSVDDKTLALLKDNWDDFSGQLKLGDELLKQLEDEEKELKDLEDQVDGPNAFLPPLLAQLEAHQSLAASHLLSTTSVALLTALLTFHTTTSTLSSATSSGALPSAVDALSAVTSAVEEGAEDWIEETDVWRALVRWAGEEESRLGSALQTALEGCFDITPASTANGQTATLVLRERIAAAPSGEFLSVEKILEAMKEFASITGRQGKSSGVLQRFAKGLLRHFVAPFLEANGRVKVGAESQEQVVETKKAPKPRVAFRFEEEEEGVHVAHLSPARSDDASASTDTIAELSSFLAFLSSHSSLLPPSESDAPPSEYAITLTAHLTPPLQSHLISSHLTPSLPHSTASLPAYLSLLSSASSFESSFLPSHGYFAFLPPRSSSSSSEVEEQRVIRSWAQRVPHHWAKAVGDSALARVRTAVKGWDWGEGETVEVEVKEEEEMLSTLLGLGLAGEGEDASAGTRTPGGTALSRAERRPGQLALETVPKGAKREMTVEEALAPKPPRPKTPPPPPRPKTPPPAEHAPPPSPTQQQQNASTTGSLKRGKLGASRIAKPLLPPRSPSPPPLFQGGDAPPPPPPSSSQPSSSLPSSTPPAPSQIPAPVSALLEPALASVSIPDLPGSPTAHTFDFLETPVRDPGEVETTADSADPEEVSGLEGEGRGHDYEVRVEEGRGESEEREVEDQGRGVVKVEEQEGLARVEQVKEEEQVEPKKEDVEEEEAPRPEHEEKVSVLHSPYPAAAGGEEEDRQIKEESVEPQPQIKEESVEPEPAPLSSPPAEEDVAPYDPTPYEPYSAPPATSSPYNPYTPSSPAHDPYAPSSSAAEQQEEHNDPFAAPPKSNATAGDFYADQSQEEETKPSLHDNEQHHDPGFPPPVSAFNVEPVHDPYADEEDPYANDPYQFTDSSPPSSHTHLHAAVDHAPEEEEAEDPYADDPYQFDEHYYHDAPAAAVQAYEPSGYEPTLYQPAVEHEREQEQENEEEVAPYEPSGYEPTAYQPLEEQGGYEVEPVQQEQQQEERAYEPSPYEPHQQEQEQYKPQPPAASTSFAYAPQPMSSYPPSPPAQQYSPAPPPPIPSVVSPPPTTEPAAAVPPPPRASSNYAPPPPKASSGTQRRVLSPANPPLRTVISPLPVQKQPSYPSIPPIPRSQPAAKSPVHYPSVSPSYYRPPSRPSSAASNNGPVLNHIQQRFVSPPPSNPNPYVPLGGAVPQQQTPGGSYLPLNDPLFADLLGGSGSSSSRPSSSQSGGNYFVPDPPGARIQRSSSVSSQASNASQFSIGGNSRSPAPQQPRYGSPQNYHPQQRQQQQQQAYNPYAPPSLQQQQYQPQHGYGTGGGGSNPWGLQEDLEELEDRYDQHQQQHGQQQQGSYGAGQAYRQEIPAMRLRGGGGWESDEEEEEEEEEVVEGYEVDEEEDEGEWDERPSMRLRGGMADLGEMDEDDGNRSADDWGFGDDSGAGGGEVEEDAWGFGDEDEAAPASPPEPVFKPPPPPPQTLPKPVAPPVPTSAAPAPAPSRAPFHAPSASVTSTTSSTFSSPPTSLSRSRPPSYAFSPALAPPSLLAPEPDDIAEEEFGGGDDWGFGDDDDGFEAPSPAVEEREKEPTPPPSEVLIPTQPKPPVPTFVASPPPPPRAATPPPPHPAAVPAPQPSFPSYTPEPEPDLEAEQDDWGFGAEEDATVDSAAAAEEEQPAAEILESEIPVDEPSRHPRNGESAVQHIDERPVVEDVLTGEEVVAQAQPHEHTFSPPLEALPSGEEEVDKPGAFYSPPREPTPPFSTAPQPVEPEPVEEEELQQEDEGGGLDEAEVEHESRDAEEPVRPSEPPVEHEEASVPVLSSPPHEQEVTQPPASFDESLQPNLDAYPLGTTETLPAEPDEAAPVEPVASGLEFEVEPVEPIEAVQEEEPSVLTAPAENITGPLPSEPEVVVPAPPTPQLPSPLPHHDVDEMNKVETTATEESLHGVAAEQLDDAAFCEPEQQNEDGWGLDGEDDETVESGLAPVESFLPEAHEAEQQEQDVPIETSLINPQPADDDGFADFSPEDQNDFAPVKPPYQQQTMAAWEPFEEPGEVQHTVLAQSEQPVDEEDEHTQDGRAQAALANAEQLIQEEAAAPAKALDDLHELAASDPPSAPAPESLNSSGSLIGRDTMSSPEVIEHSDAWGFDGEPAPAGEGAEVLDAEPVSASEVQQDAAEESVVQHELDRPTFHDESAVQHVAHRPLVQPESAEEPVLPVHDPHPQQRTVSPPLEALPHGDEEAEDASGWDLGEEAEGAEVLEQEEEESPSHPEAVEEARHPAEEDSVVQHESQRPVEPAQQGEAPLSVEIAAPARHTFSLPLESVPHGQEAVDDATGWDLEGETEGAEVLEQEEEAAAHPKRVEEPQPPKAEESIVQHESERSVVPDKHANTPSLAVEEVKPAQHTFSPPPHALPAENDPYALFSNPSRPAQPEPEPECQASPPPPATEAATPEALHDDEPSPPPTAVPVDDDAFSDDPWDLDPVEPSSTATAEEQPAAVLLESDGPVDEPSHHPGNGESAVQHIEERPVVEDALVGTEVVAQVQPLEHTFSPPLEALPSAAEHDEWGALEEDPAVEQPEAEQAVEQPEAEQAVEQPEAEQAVELAPTVEQEQDPESSFGLPSILPAVVPTTVAAAAAPLVHAVETVVEAVKPQHDEPVKEDAEVPKEPSAVSTDEGGGDDGWGWDGAETSAETPASPPPPTATRSIPSSAPRPPSPPAAASAPSAVSPILSTQPPPPLTPAASSTAPPPPTASAAIQAGNDASADDGWGWDGEDADESVTKEEKRETPVEAAREEVVEPAEPAEPEPPAPPPVRREKMMVSKRSKEIVKIAEEVLLEALEVASPTFEHPEFASATAPLLQTFVSLLSLYRATAAVHNSNLLASVPAIGMQFANDADWIGREVERVWRSATEGKALQVSEVQAREVELAIESTRQLGKDTRQKQVAIQRAALMESLDEAGGFLRTSDENRFSACERALQQVTHTLQRLALVWKPVMTSTALYTTLGGLINEVLLRVLDEIETQTDISEDESIRLNQLCKMLHELESLFDGSETSVGREVPVWFKFVFLSELLEASMADILFLFDHGHLVDFSPQEIVKLIRALFSDSPLRNRNIEKVLKGHPEVLPEEDE
ncbi:hypothetical protein JCM8547_004143 [Rhodosporidiobolus lusitaniae]